MTVKDKRITSLDVLTQADATCVIPIVDVLDQTMSSTGTTKQITTANLFASPQPIGSSAPDTGAFTTLELPAGATIDEFSIDGTLVGDSDTAVPTEKAVKTYVDAQVLAGTYIISQGDSYVQVVDDGTSTGYIEIVADAVQVAYFDSESSSIRLGKSSGAGRFVISDTAISAFISSSQILNLQADNQSLGVSGGELVSLDQTANTIILLSGAIAKLTADSSGITLENGTSVNEFSNDVTLADDSTTALVTEHAIKTYTNSQISDIDYSKIYEGYTSVECFDTTSTDTVIIKTEGLVDGPLGDSTTEVFYYTNYSTSDFTDPENMVDGNIATYATIVALGGLELYYQVNNTNNVPSSRTETITKVEVRGYNYYTGATGFTGVRPKFPGGDGDWQNLFPTMVPGWSNWVDVTDDTNAPVTWTWADVTSMDAEIRAQGRNAGDVVYVSKIEIRVTSSSPTYVPGSVERARIDSDGLTLENGTSVDEFSIDGTLAGNSDDVVPTEKAVKTYVDAADATTLITAEAYADAGDAATLVSANAYTDSEILAIDHSKIYEGYSSVECFDTTSLDAVIIKTEGLVEVPGSSATGTFYWGSQDGTSTWTNPGNMVDGNSTTTYATADNPLALPVNIKTSINNANTSTDQGGTITKVEVRAVYGYSGSGTLTLQPYFNGATPGSSYSVTLGANPPGAGPYNSSWKDITNDGQAPGTWTWSAVSALDLRVDANAGGSQTIFVYQTDIKVTYIAASTYVTESVERARIDSDGLTLENGTSVNEFSTDGTLAGNSDDAVPTEKAVKTYVDAGSDIISQDDSYVQVVDDGTAVGYIEMVADGVQVGYHTAVSQQVGVSGDSRLVLNQTADTFLLAAGANTQISGGLTSMTLGVSADTTIVLDQTTDQITLTAGNDTQMLIETTVITVYKDMVVTGDLFVDGTAWVVHNQEVTTSDNLIVMNYGEVGPGVTKGYAGFEIDRGSLTNYQFLFYENTDTFRIGEIGNLQAVATREDAPVSNNVPWWNTTEDRFDTAGATYINIDQTAHSIYISAAPAVAAIVMTINDNGVALENGVSVNDLSNDTTLSDESTSALVTEYAIKTYVDTQDAATLIAANAYADAADATTLVAAEIYADAGDAATLITANAYADGVGSATLISANTYTDTRINALTNIRYVYTDTTAVAGDVLLVDTTAGDVNVDLIETSNGTIIVKKITSGGDVIVSTSPGTIDGASSFTIDTLNQALTLVSDGTNFFIL